MYHFVSFQCVINKVHNAKNVSVNEIRIPTVNPVKYDLQNTFERSLILLLVLLENYNINLVIIVNYFVLICFSESGLVMLVTGKGSSLFVQREDQRLWIWSSGEVGFRVVVNRGAPIPAVHPLTKTR